MLTLLNQENFRKEVLEPAEPVLVDFAAAWCPPCRMLKPILEEVEQKLANKIKFAQVDIDQSRELAEKYEVMSVPTLIIFKNGKEIKRLIGLQNKQDLEKILENL